MDLPDLIDNTPRFLALTAAGSLWQQLGGQAHAGEDVIIGVLDTGIWPEHPSFSGAGYGPAPAGWAGNCQSGEQFSQQDCNNKLIGARYYLNGFGHFGVIKNDYKSARDADGHGTHTASTAGGNADVTASILGSNLGKISGMAPRARIASYKVCWNGAAGGCPHSYTTAAINQAVADGVDVINYSISGTTTNFLDAVEVSFLFAARAGVFVAASAGNSGPGAATLVHPSPWLTTVAASTHDRDFRGAVTLGNGSSYTGVTLTGGTDVLPIVDSVAAGSELCEVGKLNPSVVSGKIVLCKRGVIARVEKSLAVQTAGGRGMVLYNPTDTGTLNTDNHYVPTVHINFTNGTVVKTYIASAGAGATARIVGGSAVQVPAPIMADFSSRGPSRASADLLKPDVTAPGVNVLAGNTPAAFLGAPGQLFQSISGTSMSSPHVAGIAALLRDLHPSWTPAMIKSALMTTGSQVVAKEDGVTPATPFDMGGGHIVPNSAADPGLVYAAGYTDYLGFLKGQGLCCATSTAITAIDASDLNLASIAIGDLAGVQTVKRTVTNVGAAGKYSVSVKAPAGVTVEVSPKTLNLASGATGSYTVKFTTGSTARLGQYVFGSLTWSDRKHTVRSPLVIRPIVLSAPGSLPDQSGASGSATYNVTFGYTGNFSAQPRGLVPATTAADNVVDDPTNDFNVVAPDTNQGITKHTITIPAGTTYARFALFDASTDGADDLDLYVYRGTTLVGASGSATSAEQVSLANPAAGEYTVYVHGWETDGADANYTLFSWLLGSTSAGNMTVTAPSSATTGATAAVTVNWSGLTAATKYLGSVAYFQDASQIGTTIVRVDAP